MNSFIMKFLKQLELKQHIVSVGDEEREFFIQFSTLATKSEEI